MKRRIFQIGSLALLSLVLLIPAAECPAWVGLELDGKATGIVDPYGVTGTEGSGSLWEFSARAMYQNSLGSVDVEAHWLVQLLHSGGDIRIPLTPEKSPFRSLDLENSHVQSDRTVLLSEMDRLSLTWSTPGLSLAAGRQAVSWGEAFYYNFGDLFGAFPITETNRRYKPGIDAAAATLELGSFSSLSLVTVPVDDEDNSTAAHILFPLGPGTLSFTGGRILEDDKAGTGYTVDIAGTQVYGSFLMTSPSDGEEYSQAVAGFQRQVGPYTLLMGEIYRNGWSTGDPDDYPSLMLTDEYASGTLFTLGRYSTAFQVSQQVSPLVTLAPTVFANLSDGSTLFLMDGALSLSDLTDFRAGIFIGLGKRPDDGVWQSEYGSIPTTLYIELVHNI
jgi:hypothetical protein